MEKSLYDTAMQEASVINNDLEAAVELVIGQASTVEQIVALTEILVKKISRSKTPHNDAKYIADVLSGTDWNWRP